MIVPSTRLFTAGEVETGAYLNSAVTNLGNFMLGKPIAQLTSIATTSITAGTTGVAIPFASENIDRDNGHSTTVNTSYYTAQTAGWYYVQGSASFASTAATSRGTALKVNGTTIVAGSTSSIGIANAGFVSSSSALVYLNVGDYIELWGYAIGTTTALAAPALGSVQTAVMNVVWVSS